MYTHIYVCHTYINHSGVHTYICVYMYTFRYMYDNHSGGYMYDIYMCVHVDNRYAAVFFPNSEKTAAYESCKSWASRFYSVNRVECYGVATISRLLKIIGVFCKTALHKRLYSTKETYNFKEPTSRSHPIVGFK